MDLLTPKQAAKLIAVSYPTIKQWIYRGKIRSVRTPGGHHRIPRTEIQRLTSKAQIEGSIRKKAAPLDAISGRNKLQGTITEVKVEGLLAQITMDVGGQTMMAIITRKACEDLGLRRGMSAFALVKATEVMVIKA